MKLTDAQYVDMLSDGEHLSAMRYTYLDQMATVKKIVVAGGVLIGGVIIFGIMKHILWSDIALLIGAISGATVALSGVLAGIATAGKVAQSTREWQSIGTPAITSQPMQGGHI